MYLKVLNTIYIEKQKSIYEGKSKFPKPISI